MATAGPDDPMELATDERRDLAEFLDTISPEQWEQRSLCADWTVHQVVAHIVSYEELGPTQVAARMLRGGFRLSRTNPIGVEEHARKTPVELLDLLRAHLRPRGITAAFGGRIGLTDGLIHHQDIRRALGVSRQVPAGRLLVTLPFSLRALALPSRRDVRGLRLVATDLEWTQGDGPELSGPAEALLLAIAGRRDALADLDGPGVRLLAGRMATRLAKDHAAES